MGWRDNLKPASYRGVPFHYLSVEDEGGRRLVQHLFPGRDDPEYDDLGAAPQNIRIDAYVLGHNFHIALQTLLAALQKKGAGTLVHPHFGRRQMRAHNWRVRHTTREGGIARLSIQFVPAGVKKFPSAALDSQQLSNSAAAAVMAVAKAEFLKEFSVDDAPQFVAADALGKLDGVRAKLASINGRIAAVTQPITEFTQSVSRIGDEAAQLIRQPAELAAQLQGAYLAVVKGLPNSIKTALSFYTGFVDQDTDSSATSTPSRARVQANSNALIKLQQASAVAAAVQSSSLASYDSQEQAQDVLEQVSAMMDVVEEQSSDDVFLALRDLRAAMVEDVRRRGANLARVRTYTPIETTPALVLAYDLYGNSDREVELLARNPSIDQPNFVPGGNALEVLSA